MFTQEDIRQIEQRGSDVKTAQAQVERFKKGFPWMKIVAPATPERGICVLGEKEADEALAYYDSARTDGKCKFVPASGAASRMFKDIFAGLATLESGKDVEPGSPVHRLAGQIERFAFYSEELFGKVEDTADYRRSVASKVLGEPGLGYGSKPKGVILFHSYPDEKRTALAEHLVEAQDYMRNADGSARLVVTISPEHRELFEQAYAAVKAEYEKRYGIRYDITFTYQDKATDTIAVDAENRPFRTDSGELLFRPAGHGALIHNLNSVEEELVSIKNIDNVATEKLLGVTARYKKVLMGKALKLRDAIFAYLEAFEKEADPASDSCVKLCDEVEAFLDRELCVKLPAQADPALRKAQLVAKLDRPIRVCGMVKNEGEPGGGPYVVEAADGSTNLQILESVQIDKNNPQAMACMSSATHFNPVDLVCCLKNYRGEKFNLLEYVDQDAGFISSKSYQGRELKALELPGLWNGSMSDWNTLFVEVPLETFNPVKVILDLLRPAHQ